MVNSQLTDTKAEAEAVSPQNDTTRKSEEIHGLKGMNNLRKNHKFKA